jgi:hypothetical protein
MQTYELEEPNEENSYASRKNETTSTLKIT